MPRSARLLLSKSYYHIMTRGNNKKIIFHNNNDYKYYLNLVEKYKTLHPFNLYHYCLMPNHTHMLVQTKRPHDFSTFMKKLNLSYYHYYNREYNWTGHFFQGRYKSQPVGKDDYFIQCGKYIELNPIRSGLIKSIDQYVFSSFYHYAYGKHDSLLTDNIFYSALGHSAKKRQKRYRDLIVAETVHDTYTGFVWGSGSQRYNETKKFKYHFSK